jgi:hypothetical protein
MSNPLNVPPIRGRKQDPSSPLLLDECINEETSFKDTSGNMEKSRRNSHSSESSTESDEEFLGLSQPSSRKSLPNKNTKEKTAGKDMLSVSFMSVFYRYHTFLYSYVI